MSEVTIKFFDKVDGDVGIAIDFDPSLSSRPGNSAPSAAELTAFMAIKTLQEGFPAPSIEISP